MISHQLRTPLVTGIGYLEMLLAGTLGEVGEKAESRVKIAHRNLKRLSQLIDCVTWLIAWSILESFLICSR